METAQTPKSKKTKSILLGVLVVIALLSLSIASYFYFFSGKKTTEKQPVWRTKYQNVNKPIERLPSSSGASEFSQKPTASPTTTVLNPTSSTSLSSPTPTPSPTPALGPGPYACDSFGICNFFDDTKTHECPKTFADRNCLNQCGDKSVRCAK